MKTAGRWRRWNRRIEANATLLGGWSALISIIGLPLLLLGGAATFFQVRDYFTRPDVVLVFSNPAAPSFRIQNVSSVVARDIRYQLGLWDLDARDTAPGAGPRNLKVPIQSVSYARGEASVGPWVIEELANVNPRVPAGHVIFGVASVQCPDCVTKREYWVYFKKGEAAWVAPMSPAESVDAGGRLASILSAGSAYEAAIQSAVGASSRSRVE